MVAVRLARYAALWDGFDLGSVLPGEKVDVPVYTKDAMKYFLDSLRASLKHKVTRFDVDFPTGFRLGSVEGGSADILRLEFQVPTKEQVSQAEQDVALWLAHHFKTKQDSLMTVFRTPVQVKMATKQWEQGRGGTITSFSKGSSKKSAFASDEIDIPAFVKSVQDGGCSVVVIVAPRKKHLRAVLELARRNKEVTIVLANARLRCQAKSDETREEARAVFYSAFHLDLAGRPLNEAIVYHAMREEGGKAPWVLARKTYEVKEDGREITVVKELLRKTSELSPSEIASAAAG